MHPLGTLEKTLISSLHRTWAPPSAHQRMCPTDQAYDSLSSLRKPGRGTQSDRLAPGPQESQ